MERILQLWFSVSALVVTLFAGWSAVRFGVSLQTLISAIAAGALILVTLTRSTLGIRVLATASATAAFMGGVWVGTQNPGQVNEWMENSTVMLWRTVKPADVYEGDAGKIVLSKSERARLSDLAAKVELFPNDLEAPLLMSFQRALAVIDGDEIHFLTTTGATLSLSGTLPDGSFLYVHPFNVKPTAIDKNAVATLTRAVMRDNVLYKLWDRPVPGEYLHHWGDAFAGKIYYPGRRFVNLPDALSADIGGGYGECTDQDTIRDVLHVLDADTGKVERTIDMLTVLEDLRDQDRGFAKLKLECKDPLHFNDVQIVKTAKQAKAFPDGKVGDVLVSFRNIDAVVLLDRDTQDVKWYVEGSFHLQHSPRLTDRGTMLLFDNMGGKRPNGSSRILEIDVASKKTVGLWEATGDDFFESRTRGKLYLVGDRLLVEEQGAMSKDNDIFLLDCPSHPISQECRKTMVLEATSRDSAFDNAVVLNGGKKR